MKQHPLSDEGALFVLKTKSEKMKKVVLNRAKYTMEFIRSN